MVIMMSAKLQHVSIIFLSILACSLMWLFGGRDDGSPFPTLPGWKVASPAYAVTNTCVVTATTHTDRLVMSGHTNPIWSLVNYSVDSLLRFTCSLKKSLAPILTGNPSSKVFWKGRFLIRWFYWCQTSEGWERKCKEAKFGVEEEEFYFCLRQVETDSPAKQRWKQPGFIPLNLKTLMDLYTWLLRTCRIDKTSLCVNQCVFKS